MSDDKKVDESWKEQAKAEQAPAPPSGKEPHGPPPPADFSSLVVSLATGALMALGGEDEEGKETAPDLDRARYSIDMLDMLSAKTKGNLAPDEERHLAAILHQLRMAFVQATKKPKS